MIQWSTDKAHVMATALQITDDVTTCDCCGRSGLKRTVLMRLDDESLVNYGTTCAARNTGKDQRQIKQEVYAEQAARAAAASWEYRTSAECRALRSYRELAPWKRIGFDAYNNSPIVLAAQAAHSAIAAKHGVPAGSY